MNYSKIIGTNIRYERRLRGLTIDDFAKIIGMAPGFVGLIERGQRGTSISNMVKIAEFFNITLDDLITKDLSHGEAVAVKELKRASKDRKALISMINSLDDNKVQILAANAKALNKYIPSNKSKDDEDEVTE